MVKRALRSGILHFLFKFCYLILLKRPEIWIMVVLYLPSQVSYPVILLTLRCGSSYELQSMLSTNQVAFFLEVKNIWNESR